MVPGTASSLMLKALSPDDFYQRNSLPRVKIDRKAHGEYALNDLVLELSNFLEEDTVRKVELSLLEGSLKKTWKLQDDFRLVEQRNKEIDLTLKELEEMKWRLGSVMDKSDLDAISQMLGVGRGFDNFDKEFQPLDSASLTEFFNESNSYDDRVTLLENWICRKEEEIRTRVNLPTAEMKKSDGEAHTILDKRPKTAREALVGKMLTKDEFGNSVNQKRYEELTSSELHMLVESLSIRLNLFNNKYPSFVP